MNVNMIRNFDTAKLVPFWVLTAIILGISVGVSFIMTDEKARNLIIANNVTCYVKDTVLDGENRIRLGLDCPNFTTQLGTPALVIRGIAEHRKTIVCKNQYSDGKVDGCTFD